jgi:hypothetical protein
LSFFPSEFVAFRKVSSASSLDDLSSLHLPSHTRHKALIASRSCCSSASCRSKRSCFATEEDSALNKRSESELA